MLAARLRPASARARAAVLVLAAALAAGGCAATAGPDAPALPPAAAAAGQADALLLGEQHDAADHQALHRQTVAALAARRRLAALALEMAEQGRSTDNLPRDAGEAAVREALAWNDEAWPWAAYGPAVMAAVRAGVPVLGANLPRARMRGAMADAQLDTRLPAPALEAQRQAIRDGHCGLLPEAQIPAMARVQVARDVAMAATVAQAARPGRTVVLLAGSGHVDEQLGVPRHLPPALQARAVRWPLPAGGPAKDYCAELRQQLAPKS